ncbi:MAG TPA: ABC transporter substrate-binding protein [Chthoniobacterales bacterium]
MPQLFHFHGRSNGTRALSLGVAFACFFTSLGVAQFLSTEHPVAPDQISLGMSGPESGRIGPAGVSVKEGYLAAFERFNRAGGIHGRKIRLVAYDDQSEGLNGVVNTERLINQDRVLALVGYSGASVSESVLAMIEGANLAFFAPLSGAAFLQDPKDRYTFNLRASCVDEIRMLVTHLVEDAAAQRIGLVWQRDDHGQSVHDALLSILEERHLKLVGDGRYLRNESVLKEAFDQVADAKPDAIILSGAFAPSARLVRYAHRYLREAVVCCTSAICMESLQRLSGADAEGVVAVEVVPFPAASTLGTGQEYRHDMNAVGATRYDHASYEAYIGARFFGYALEQAGPLLTEQVLLTALAGAKCAFDGLTFAFGAGAAQTNHRVVLARVRHGRLSAIDRIEVPSP